LIGFYTISQLARNYASTENPVPKNFYALSMLFSISAIGNAGLAIVSLAGRLSSPALLSEIFGVGFMWCTDFCLAIALKTEVRQVPCQVSRRI